MMASERAEPPREATTGPGDGPAATRPATIAALPFFAAGRFPRPDLLGQCRGGEVVYTSGRELVERVRDLSLGLSALGMRPGDHVALLSESRPEWLLADFAILTAGAVTVPIYPTLSIEQIGFILRDSGASLLVVSSAAQLEKVLAALPEAPALRQIVTIEPAASGAPVPVASCAEVSELGRRRIRDGWGVARDFHDAARRVRPDDLATIIYTSGTTGDPKGVMLTHGNLIANLTGALSVLDVRDTDVALSFLPLCHAFERIVAYVYLTTGVSMVFAESIDTIARDLLVARPTVMTGVPRVFEKLYARVSETGEAAGPVRRRLFHWAVAVARERGRRLGLGGGRLGWWLRLQAWYADRLVFGRIRAGVGGRLRYAVSGSAPLAPELGAFFYGVGLPVLEGYGLTETSPVLCVMPLQRIRFGTVGPPLPNVELRIAEDGEILARGPNVMRGYHQRPDETAAALAGGWFQTGDIGALDADGYLRITDRKKEVLVTSGGKKIAPQPIEQRLRQHPLVAEAIVIGDRRHFPAALLVPDLGALAAVLGVDETAARGRLETPEVHARYQAVVDAVNRDLARFEQIKKFVMLADDLTVASGVLTPTLKVKRRVIEERYRGVIDRIYA